jgi:flagellar basal body-associated protein FliL
MEHLTMNRVGQARQRRTGEQAQARVIILAMVSFLIGIAVSAWWLSRKPSAEAASQTALPGDTTADVTHVLARSANVSPQPQPAPRTDLAALDAVKRAIPNVNSASLEEGTRVLREAALAEFRQTAQELQARQKKLKRTLSRDRIIDPPTSKRLPPNNCGKSRRSKWRTSSKSRQGPGLKSRPSGSSKGLPGSVVRL